MNERIQELAKAAGFPPQRSFSDLSDLYPRLDKFAELIVGECLEIVNRKEYSYHEADPLWETAELIKEHFGVEP